MYLLSSKVNLMIGYKYAALPLSFNPQKLEKLSSAAVFTATPVCSDRLF